MPKRIDSRHMAKDLKNSLVNRLKQVGAYEVRVGNPHVGFENALEGKHPLDLWADCKSVVVFVVARSPRVNNTYVGPYSRWIGSRDVGPVPQDIQSPDYAMDRLARLFLASITLKGMALLQANGHSVSFATPQAKLCAFEAGIGVYGRSGLILHPELGNRMSIGIILTDAIMQADPRLEHFKPCETCELCIKMCPAHAFDSEKEYPHSWSREKCTSKRAQLEARGLYCHNCFAVCPAGRYKDEELLSIKESTSIYKQTQ